MAHRINDKIRFERIIAKAGDTIDGDKQMVKVINHVNRAATKASASNATNTNPLASSGLVFSQTGQCNI